ncbi:MAG: hypothetical protein J6W74_02590 [Bacteroidales bacterium]|nr:hypothetical protein [Bacteroidales bacterium]
MIRRLVHIILTTVWVLLLAGCIGEENPRLGDNCITLTVRCDNGLTTKSDKDGERAFNENIIHSVDFLFYQGTDPGLNEDAVYHIRKELSEDPMHDGVWEATFNLTLKKDIIGLIFTEANGYRATVYALVNFDSSFVGDLSGTSRAELAARQHFETDFAEAESNYLMPHFLMDGKTTVLFDKNANPNVSGEIEVKRFASKLTVAINVADRVVLKHQEAPDPADTEPDEVWTPVLHTMRIYLVDGVKTTRLSHDGATLPDPAAEDNVSGCEHFSYNDNSNKRPYFNDSGVPYMSTETVSEKVYYNTWPMYSYPTHWSASSVPDYPNLDYTQGLPNEPPYLKLEMDWRREAENGYSYDRRKYYYKVFMPFDAFVRNNWYGFYLDVSILGSETDEGKAILTPTCYLLDWQNKSFSINKYAVISKARYLSLDKSDWVIHNVGTLSIPFLSSHNVMVVTSSVKATRPYYGKITTTEGERVGDYNTKYHAWIRQNSQGGYYLDYNNQPSGNEAYEPANWLTNTSTSINLNHPLQNNYQADGFDYSPYSIEFDIVHSDLAGDPTSHTYSQYLRHITILQNPGIYIEALTNSDTDIIEKGGNNPYGYADGSAPWADKPWGYVYVNGGRFLRKDKITTTSSADPYWKLSTNKNKAEYQWQAVWYTGGGRDIFNIHVTVLPSDSDFVIGDPREDDVNLMDDPATYANLYEFTVDGGDQDLSILEAIRDGTTEYPGRKRTGFNEADALFGNSWRKLTWYYPTEKSPRTENMLSPGYRISTKFGGTEFGNLTKPFAEYRCAAYQEDGFPAGRWRLPTKAEINFIAQLSAKKVFEHIFTNGTGSATYWSANGAISVNADSGTVTNSTTDKALLRCVYDSWYWDRIDIQEGLKNEGDDPRHNPRTKFIWGDKER